MTYLDDAWHRQSDALLRRAVTLVIAGFGLIDEHDTFTGEVTWHRAAARLLSDYERRDEWTVGDNQDQGSSPGEVWVAQETSTF